MRYDPEEYYPEDDVDRCPECGGRMQEEYGLYQDFSDEYGDAHEVLVGWICKKCGASYGINGEEVA